MIDLTPLKKDLQGKPVAIYGLGKSNMAAYAALKAAGIKSFLWDDKIDAVEKAKAAGAEIADLSEADFKNFAMLIIAPGINPNNKIPAKAAAAGCEVLCDIELFGRVKPNAVTIGITGTNGKSTTTALIGHILHEAGIAAEVGGNIGNAVLSLKDLGSDSVYVFELSSYQLELCPSFAPQVAVFTNISADHLERHGTLEKYIAAKERIFRGEGTAVICVDDEYSKAVAARVKAKGERKIVEITYDDKAKFDLGANPALSGKHNWQNAAQAFAAVKALGISEDKIKAAIKTFAGLEHRQKIVALDKGVTYINDSKATNDQAAAKALAAFKNIYWIAGGKSKGAGYAECEAEYSNVRHGFLVGEAAEEIAQSLARYSIPYTMCETIDNALLKAKAMAEKDAPAVVLLSPACASFDQFNNFEERGDFFCELCFKTFKESLR